MTAVVGEVKGPTGHAKNCDSWAGYEAPLTSESANLCNGGSHDGYRWQPCPSRIDCRDATRTASGQTSGVQLLGSTSSRLGWGKTTLPTQKEQPVTTPQAQVVVQDEDHPYLKTPKLETRSTYQTSPVFLPVGGESLLERALKNGAQAMVIALFQQILELARHVDFFPSRRKTEE